MAIGEASSRCPADSSSAAASRSSSGTQTVQANTPAAS